MAAWQGLSFIEWPHLCLAVGLVSAGAVGMIQPCVFHSLASLASLEVQVRVGKVWKWQESKPQSANTSLLLLVLLLLMSYWPSYIGKVKFKWLMSLDHGLIGKLQSHVAKGCGSRSGNIYENFSVFYSCPFGSRYTRCFTISIVKSCMAEVCLLFLCHFIWDFWICTVLAGWSYSIQLLTVWASLHSRLSVPLDLVSMKKTQVIIDMNK